MTHAGELQVIIPYMGFARFITYELCSSSISYLTGKILKLGLLYVPAEPATRQVLSRVKKIASNSASAPPATTM